jgi:hypothetical protein
VKIKKWCKLAKDIKAKRCKPNGHKIRDWCTCKFVVFGTDTSGNSQLNL